MQVTETNIPAVKLLTPKKFGDNRGFFSETFNRNTFRELVGVDVDFVQDNQSLSVEKGVVRGLHYQLPPTAQAKLVRVTRGAILDVAVDIRRGSPTFGRWTAVVLSAENKRHFWIPEGFAHGFVTLSERAVFTYLCTATYDPVADASVRWDDPQLAIDWPIRDVQLSDKDARAPVLADIAAERLPVYSPASA
jgi:dTDP-4-dehydrorhamnose 3,5-epimerase